MKNFDIIGDIHGYASTLETMLHTLGYSLNTQGYYSHDSRKVIFVGDFIDRLSGGQRAVIDIVRPMVDNGSALAVMGNHEFNAIAYHSLHPETGLPLRNHSPNHQRQHQAFLDEYGEDETALKTVIDWFKTLPLYLELDDFRVIHACWHHASFKAIKDDLVDGCLTASLLLKATQKGSAQFDAVEVLLKGLEIPLPEGISFKDSYDNNRHDIRIKWWEEATTYKEYALVPPQVAERIPELTIPAELLSDFRYEDDKPVFFGHYWFSGQPQILKQNVACLDYSVARGDKLVAYRWNDGDKELSNNQFIQVLADEKVS